MNCYFQQFLFGLAIVLISNLQASRSLWRTRPVIESTLKIEAGPQEQAAKARQKQFYVRVLLAEGKTQEGVSWCLQSSDGFTMQNVHTQERMTAQMPKIFLSCDGVHLYINGKKIRDTTISIEPRAKSCIFGESVYEGTFLFCMANQKVYLINSINLEDYVYAVLRWEGWPGWPIEVNKAFAIMCRSYVIAKVLEARAKEKKALFDIRNTNIHQTYKGTHSSTHIREAVEATLGVVLSYQKKPIVAMYDSCCGGVIPSKISDVDFSNAPYLARPYACTFCRDCKIYTWRTAYSLADFNQRVGNELKLEGPIKALKISEKDRAGLVREIKVRAHKSWLSLSGKKIYNLFKEIKSLCFSLQLLQDKVVITGWGYGHQLGLCQWGARQMVKDGWNYKRVLNFYYPGTQFMKVEVV